MPMRLILRISNSTSRKCLESFRRLTVMNPSQLKRPRASEKNLNRLIQMSLSH